MPTDAPPDAGTFEDLDLRSELVEVLAALGYEEPTPIQRQAIPPLLEGRDLVGQAATGTGKTAAFALPLLHRLPEGDRGKQPSALVLAPTRELAVQVAEAVTRYGAKQGARVLAVYGGQPITPQLKVLQRGVDIVVGTPGRVVDHLNRGSLRLDALQTVVLDEADEMFDMGFADEIEAILGALPAERQTVLFSATMPPKIAKMARSHQKKDAVRIQVERDVVPAGEAPKVTQTGHLVMRHDKPAALARLLDMHSPAAAIVFCRTREEVDSLTEALKTRGLRAEPLHGGMSQAERDRVMNRLRGGTADLLIATDVAARGLDVDHLTHVVNYNVPPAPESYVHRIGRVGRAGREGVALTLVEPRERRMLEQIERLTGTKVPLLPVPTAADLRAKRLDATRIALLEVLQGGDVDAVRAVLGELEQEYDAKQIALAAISLLHRAGSPADTEDIAEVSLRQERPTRDDGPREQASRSYAAPARGEGPRSRGGAHQRSGPPERKGPRPGWAKLYIGAGRGANVRPQDLVGAIAGESHLTGKQIGSIEITEKFSLVEVPEPDIDAVIKALRASVIKGRKVPIRRDRDA